MSRSASPRPKVSVSILTYNQREMVKQAIDSALMQETDFPFEIRIGDDFSDDGTRAVLEDYRARHPDRIFLNLQPRRPDGIVGRLNNMTNLASCRGEYIAMLDGDDYWTDRSKLQRQADLLDADPSLGGTAHDALIVDDDPAKPDTLFFDEIRRTHPRRARLTLNEVIISPPFIPSCFMFRAALIDPFPDWFAQVPAADWALFALVANAGDIAMLQQAWTVYRRHSASVLGDLNRVSMANRHRWVRNSFHMIRTAFPPSLRTRRLKAFEAKMQMFEYLGDRNYGKALATLPAMAWYDTTNLPHYADRGLRRLLGLRR